MKKQINKRPPSVKLKGLRLGWDDLKSFMKGFRFAREKVTISPALDCWFPLAEFSTMIRNREELGEVNQNRVHNMELCCSLIDGLVLHPGEIFSFRKAVGEPSVARGFLTGPMIVGGDLGLTAGGGLCQITTTLFNAALLANLKILEKHNHSTDIWGEKRMIDLGRDAVCVYGRKDLKFGNIYPGRILLRIEVDTASRRVICRILSESCRQILVEVTSRILKELKPHPAYKEQLYCRPVPGWLVETIRRVNFGKKIRTTYKKREVYHPAWKKVSQ